MCKMDPIFSDNEWTDWWRHRPKSCSSQQLLDILIEPTNGRIVLPIDSYNQVFDGIYIGDQSIAKNVCQLKQLNISHVLNAAFGTDRSLNLVYVSPEVYSENNIQFHGIEAYDCETFGLWTHFEKSTQFMDQCLERKGKVLVHCREGISRSATLVIAYLMIKKDFSVTEAMRTVRRHREILPNDGFLIQLCLLNDKLVSNKTERLGTNSRQ